MDNRYNFDLGKEIGDVVDRALNSKNFENLNEKINEKINENIERKSHTNYGATYHNRSEGASNYGRSYQYETRRHAQSASQNRTQTYRKRSGYNFDNTVDSTARVKSSQNIEPGTAVAIRGKNSLPPALYNKPKEATSGKFLIGIGSATTAVFGLSTVNALIAGSVLTAILGPAVVLAGGLAALGIGIAKNAYAQRFYKYARASREKKYVAISDLASAVGRSEESVRADLEKMIDNYSFRQGHIDETGTTLIVTDELYDQYKKTQENARVMEAEKQEKIKQGIIMTDEVQALLDSGEGYLKRIHRANEEMPEAVITAKLDRLEGVIQRIFERVKEQPKEARKLNQFMDYYLPTTLKLVNAYKEIENKGDDVETVVNTKNEILESLDSISDAYEKLLDSMFRDKALDVSTDISVMKTMMKQDGLTSDDFKLGN